MNGDQRWKRLCPCGGVLLWSILACFLGMETANARGGSTTCQVDYVSGPIDSWNPTLQFGWAVGLSGDVAAVGAALSDQRGVQAVGRAYVYRSDPVTGGLVLEQEVLAPTSARE